MLKFLIFLIVFTLFSCGTGSKQKEIELKEKEIALRERELKLKEDSLKQYTAKITLSDAITIAENKFSKYLPKIEKSHEGIIDTKETFTGDFTNDGIEDIAIAFTIVPSDGGNAILAQGISFYSNIGNNVKVIAGFDPGYLFSVDRIFNNKVYITKHIYMPNDPHCCPSISRKIELSIMSNKVLEKNISTE